MSWMSCLKRSAAPILGLAVLVATVSQVKGDAGRGTLFGLNPGGGGSFLTIDQFTGAITLTGSPGAGNSVPSLATDPTDGTLYVGTGASDPNLCHIDANGVPLGPCVLTNLGIAAIGGMDFREDGTLFAAVNIAGGGGTGSDHLATIDPTTGVATIIGPFGDCSGNPPPFPADGFGSCTIEGIEGIAFDFDGVLWGAHTVRGAAGGPGIYMISPSTGAATFIVDPLDGGVPISGGLSSIQFGCDGTLYGGTATSIPIPPTGIDGGRLVTIDVGTSSYSFVGPLTPPFQTPNGGGSLSGLAFGVSCVVEVDIKPGDAQNCFNNNGNGVIPVAILGSATLDVTQIDAGSVMLQGMAVKMVGKSNKLLATIENVNGDAFDDLLVKIEDMDGVFIPGDTMAEITGSLVDGNMIKGTDSVCIVQ